MKVTRYENRYTISCTENEFEILGIAVDQIETGDPSEYLAEHGLRGTWGQRTKNGPFLRIDIDRRGEWREVDGLQRGNYGHL